MTISTIGEKFINDLAALYDAELRFGEAQNAMFEQASSALLKSMIAEHRTQTMQQIGNIERIFALLGTNPIRGDNPAAAGLVQLGERTMSDARENPLYRDCVIASAIGQVEHFEIACYRNLVETAKYIKRADIGELLEQNLNQEQQTAKRVEDSYPAMLDDAVNTQKLQGSIGVERSVAR